MCRDISRCEACSRWLNLNMASTLIEKVLLQMANQGLLLHSLLRFGISRVNYSRYNIIHEVLWYEYITMRLWMQLQTTFGLEIEIYVTNFQCPVQAMEAKRLEKWCILQCSNFRWFEWYQIRRISDSAHFLACFKDELFVGRSVHLGME